MGFRDWVMFVDYREGGALIEGGYVGMSGLFGPTDQGEESVREPRQVFV